MADPVPNDSGERHFLDGGGEAARMIRARDWSTHPLGAPETWPDTLRTALSLTLNSPESMILAWGPELFFFFNDTYFPLLGPRIDWAMGERFDLVWADGWDQALPIIEDAMAGRSRRFVDLPWKLDTDRGAAETFWTFSYSRILDPAGEPAGLFILTNETTSRVLTDAALARSQAELTTLNTELERRVTERTLEIDRLWETSPDLLISLSLDGIVRRVNPAWTDILGYAAEEMIGRFIGDLVHVDDVAATERALEFTRGQRLLSMENRYRHKDGSYRWLSWVAAPTEAEIFAIGRHVTAQKEAEAALRRVEEQLRQSARIEAIGHLTGGMAHDFNNLLTVVIGALDLILKSPDDAARRRKLGDAALSAARRGERLTHQLLAFSRRQALRPEATDLNALIQESDPLFRRAVGEAVEYRVKLREGGAPVVVDPAQFEAALLNLIVNARDAVAEGGGGPQVITIETASCDVEDGEVFELAAGRYVCVTVSDTGAGMTPETMARVFEPFFTTKPVGKGTGLGLSQVYGFARQSGGGIKITSEAGRGAEVCLYLPLALEAIGSETTVVSQPRAIAADQRLLLVEDDAGVGAIALDLLTGMGLEVVMAENAAAALEALGREPFDLMLSDVVMPGGMTGIELARTAAALYPDLRIVLTSGYAGDDVDTALDGAPWPFVRKPYTGDQLADALGNLPAR